MFTTIIGFFGGSYVKIGIIIVAILGIFYLGWHTRDNDYQRYKMEVIQEAEKQKAHTESIQKQQEITTKGIEDEYNAKLALVRQYYANGVRQSNSARPVSSLSTTTAIADAISNYNLLSSQCAETTIQLIELQKWINEQFGIK